MIRLSITVGAGRLELDKKFLRATFRSVGNEIAAVTRAMLRKDAGGGRVYRGPGGSANAYRGGYARGPHQASAPGQPPAKITGTLANSIVVRPFKTGEGVAVRERAFYALFLSAGAKGGIGSGRRGVKGKRNKRGATAGSRVLLPRPSLSLALDQRADSIGVRLKEATLSGLKFRRMKA